MRMQVCLEELTESQTTPLSVPHDQLDYLDRKYMRC